MFIPFIAWTIDRYGLKAFPGRIRRRKIPKELDWDLCWELRHTRTTLKNLFLSIGAAGGITERVPLGDRDVTLLKPLSECWALAIQLMSTASVGSVYVDEFKRGYFPDSCPPSFVQRVKLSLEQMESQL
jgi:hypothetical protein